MNRKGIILVIGAVLLILVIGYVYLSFNGYPQKKSDIAKEVQTSLLNQRSYTSDDIMKIEGVYSFKNKKYQATVNFKDEPNVNYTYELNNGKLKLIETSNIHGKHMDETFSN
ncbi:DUF3139 domain-containing protein [Paenibacillus sp. P46E]|uniref:DUF3139 domain-containing protein n=1 Tax=Paenibacillus sp. P46E TaxID=1349436 RepID=UPI00093C82F6|nr:DUF3139 domain-containing protein [Paenibacillus sp. P46E]OKP99643.1 hypothetical protein A3849_03830 [Paenibacillus sp. P46E]